jgi:hypothetical protein
LRKKSITSAMVRGTRITGRGGDDDAIEDRRGEDPEPAGGDRGRDVQQRDRGAEPTSRGLRDRAGSGGDGHELRSALADTVLADVRGHGAAVAVGVDDVTLFGLVRVTVHQLPKYLIWSPTLMVSLLWSVARRSRLLGANLLPVDELIVGRGQLPLEPFGVGAGRCGRDLDIPAWEGAA